MILESNMGAFGLQVLSTNSALVAPEALLPLIKVIALARRGRVEQCEGLAVGGVEEELGPERQVVQQRGAALDLRGNHARGFEVGGVILEFPQLGPRLAQTDAGTVASWRARS